MEWTLEQKYSLIAKDIKKFTSKNPITIVKEMMHKEYINMHGPEHHFLDGAAFLIAYKNAGGNVDSVSTLEKLKERTIKMPGAMCGLWGICGSTASVGAALSILHSTGPLSNDQFYKDHMKYTSKVIQRMSEIGGPRCCKRNAFLALLQAGIFVKETYGVEMELNFTNCAFSEKNQQCLKEQCPFYFK